MFSLPTAKLRSLLLILLIVGSGVSTYDAAWADRADNGSSTDTDLLEMGDISCLKMLTDINFDCEVSLPDLIIVASQWLSESCSPGPCADMDSSLRVDLADLAIVSGDWKQTAETIVLNEIMADNEYDSTAAPGTNIADNFGYYSDWIEIKNLGDTPQNLEGWYLTDDDDLLNKWSFPDVTIGAKGFLIVYASERDISISGQPLHTNFMLDDDGEYLALIRPDLTIAHEYDPYLPQDDNETYGLTLPAGEEGLIASLLGSPTPGWDNAEAVTAERPEFSQASGTFTSSFTLELSTTDPNFVIRYTLDGSIPQQTSALYTGPLTITETSRVRARVFHPVMLPGAVVSRQYLFLASNVQSFTSDLPVIVVENFDVGSIPSPDGELQSSTVAVFEPDAFSGRTSMTDEAELITRAGIRRRGRSTANNPKGSYKLEFWDEKDWDEDHPLLSMPSDSDWVLHGPYRFDLAMVRNAFIHQLSNDAGQYAVRTRYAEMFVNEDGGDVSYNDYAGVYVVMEQIKRGDKRVDITHMNPSDVTPPAVTGGYILAIDDDDPGDIWFTANSPVGTLPTGDGKYLIKYPQEIAISSGQINYAIQFIDDLIAATYGPSFKDPATGFRAYIDEESLVDHNLLNMLAKNVDALRLSTYMSKDRNEKLKFGPIWDFDRSIDSTDGRDNEYNTWRGTGDATNYFTHDWWNQFFQDDDFRLRYADRWYQLREGAFGTSHITGLVDSLASQIEEAQVRNFNKWTAVAPDNWQNEVDHVKWWLQNRVAWIDSQMAVEFAPRPPLFNQDGGDVIAGFELTMASQTGVTYSDVELVAEGASVRVHIPMDNSLGETWTTQSFAPNPANWTDGSTGTGVGYERNSGYEALIDTDVELEMYNTSASVLCRIEFAYDGSMIDELNLLMKYDDGFVAYINGTEVCRSPNVINDIPGQADAGGHESGSTFDDFDISSYIYKLDTGMNMLAIHGINASTTSSDMLVLPKLVARVVQVSGGDVWYTTDGSDPRLFGLFSGVINPTADEYTVPVVINHSVKILARSHDPLWSALNEATFSVGPIAENLRITEIMYHPADPNCEFIELQNVGSEAINLNLVHFTDGIDFTFGNTSLAAGQYTLIVQNATAFETKYGSGLNIAGQYTGKLDNGGEEIVLRNAIGVEIHDFDYEDGWYELTDGLGYSLTMVDPASSDPNDWDSKSGWRSSLYAGGTPGQGPEAVLATDSIVFNELLAHSHTGNPDWIELYNTTGQNINISGWFLSDDDSDPDMMRKYKIPDPTVINSGSYKVFVGNLSFNDPTPVGGNVPFGLSKGGETVYLYSGNGVEVTGLYQTQQKFDASETGMTLGRYEKSELSGGYDFVRQVSASQGLVNNGPLIPNIVITEIYYNPPAGADHEFVELYNRTGSAVTLESTAATETSPGVFVVEDIPWRLEGTGYEFPPGVTIPAYTRILVAKDPTNYSSAPCVVYGPYDGKLDNGGEELEIQIPGDQDYGEDRYWIPIEKIDYDDAAPWPTSADGGGDSLHRDNVNAYGRDHSNWHAGAPTPGS